eukprot:SAG31_NODE_217_length_19988_cov_53.300820_2_plen_372_part_00
MHQVKDPLGGLGGLLAGPPGRNGAVGVPKAPIHDLMSRDNAGSNGRGGVAPGVRGGSGSVAGKKKRKSDKTRVKDGTTSGAGVGKAQVAMPAGLGSGGRWPPGSTIVVTGLVNAAQHNGKRGVVKRFDKAKGRYVVELLDATATSDGESSHGTMIRLKSENALLEARPEDVAREEVRESIGTNADSGIEGLFGGAKGGAKQGRALIQEVSQSHSGMSTPTPETTPQQNVPSEFQKPKITYSSRRIAGSSGENDLLTVSISLPGRRNAKGTDLAVSATALTLDAGKDDFDASQMTIDLLPTVVDPDQVKAKFDKSTSTLNVTLQIVEERQPIPEAPPSANPGEELLNKTQTSRQQKAFKEPGIDIQDLAKLF